MSGTLPRTQRSHVSRQLSGPDSYAAAEAPTPSLGTSWRKHNRQWGTKLYESSAKACHYNYNRRRRLIKYIFLINTEEQRALNIPTQLVINVLVRDEMFWLGMWLENYTVQTDPLQY